MSELRSPLQIALKSGSAGASMTASGSAGAGSSNQEKSSQVRKTCEGTAFASISDVKLNPDQWLYFEQFDRTTSTTGPLRKEYTSHINVN